MGEKKKQLFLGRSYYEKAKGANKIEALLEEL